MGGKRATKLSPCALARERRTILVGEGEADFVGVGDLSRTPAQPRPARRDATSRTPDRPHLSQRRNNVAWPAIVSDPQSDGWLPKSERRVWGIGTRKLFPRRSFPPRHSASRDFSATKESVAENRNTGYYRVHEHPKPQ